MNKSKYTANNLLLVRKHFNNLYHYIRNRDRASEQYVLSDTRSGAPNLQITIDEKAVWMYSNYDPIREAEVWVEKLEASIGDAQHIFIYGMGLGYHVEQLLKKYPDRCIHIVEPELEMMLAAIESRDLSYLLTNKNIGLFAIGDDELTVKEFVNGLTAQLSHTFYAIYTPYYLKYYADSISRLAALFKSAIQNDRINYRTREFFKREWPENIITNLEYMLHSKPLDHLKGRFERYPAIIVGSGPSLDDDIAFLKSYQGKAMICAAGTSVQALLNHGIKPHLVVSLDGSEKNYEAFRDLNLTSIPFVFSSFLKHRILDEMDSHDHVYHCFIGSDSISSYIFNIKDRSKLFYSTASVTGTVIQLAAYLGTKTIIFTGQDLSFPGHAVYAKQVDHFNHAEQKMFIDRAKEEVENVRGGKNPTTIAMINTLENIEMIVSIYKNNIRFINTSQIGAVIKGTESIAFQDLHKNVVFCSITQDQLRDEFQKEATCYSSSEKKYVFHRIHGMKDDLEWLVNQTLKLMEQEMEVLRNKGKQRNKKAVEGSLVRIHSLWQKITGVPSFIAVASVIVQSQMELYKRYLPEIIREQDMLRRGELVAEHLGALVRSIQLETPSVITLLEQVLNKLKKVQTEWE